MIMSAEWGRATCLHRLKTGTVNVQWLVKKMDAIDGDRERRCHVKNMVETDRETEGDKDVHRRVDETAMMKGD